MIRNPITMHHQPFYSVAESFWTVWHFPFLDHIIHPVVSIFKQLFTRRACHGLLFVWWFGFHPS